MILAANYIMLSSSYEIQLKIDLVGKDRATCRVIAEGEA
jgi:hypothetical protein